MGDRMAATASLGSLVEGERRRLTGGVSEERREQLAAAERRRAVLNAWNTVCGGTIEGAHVTGLHYAAASNELVVYVDEPAWTQELTMMREIIRARMAIAGVDMAGLVFRTSREGYRSKAMGGGEQAPHGPAGASAEAARAPQRELSEEELAWVERSVEPIEDQHLKQALKQAMVASLALQEPEKS